MKRMLKKLLAGLLVMCLLPACCLAQEEEPRQIIPYPDELQITIAYEEWTHEPTGQVREVAVPITCREDVNAILRQAQEKLFAEIMPYADEEDIVELRATYRISGQSWAGFMLTGRVVSMHKDSSVGYLVEKLDYLCQDVYSFDMATGEPLTLANVFPADSPAWDKVSQAVQDQLNAFYPDRPHNQQQIAAYASREALASVPILPSAGRFVVSLPLWTVIEDCRQLCNVSLMYPHYREWMTETALAQTDNSHRPIIAITYDDGPERIQTHKALRHLATYGASATFFCIGMMLEKFPLLGMRELDGMHTVGNHSYEHEYEFTRTISQLRQERLQNLELHRQCIGIEPALFRAPGGHCEKYAVNEIGWPVILWNKSAGDTGNNTMKKLYERVVRIAEDGDIILMHDIRKKTVEGTEFFLQQLASQGYLFATVDELLCLYGNEAKPDWIYYNALSEPVKMPLY